MKIISKYKDYYDYLVGIYGEDEKIIFERSPLTTMPPFPPIQIITLYICGWCYRGVVKDGMFFWGEDLLLVGEKAKNIKYNTKFHYTYYSSVKIKNGIKILIGNVWEVVNMDVVLDDKEINIKENCPIVLETPQPKRNSFEHYNLPNLTLLNINKLISAQEMYMMLTKWLSPKEVGETIREDREKIVGHGFDLKTSFRGK